jgi:selenocysteine-specific elongation factor
MTPRHLILGTAGHVDHGKSALVRALTGTDPDRLPEEKLRGITIDLGFAELTLSQPPATAAQSFAVGIVDVPGHEDFIKNMVAGAGAIDAALLVIAADDGWMPQTEEHLQILTYLGVRASVVALSKADLFQTKEQEESVVASIRARLEGTPLASAPIVLTSIQTSRGIDALQSALATELSRLPTARDIGKPRLAVDRAFTLKGAGTIVTGTLIGGCLSRGQSIALSPSGITTKIRTMQRHNRPTETALPGSRVALNLPDLHPASRDDGSLSNRTVRRGDVITLPTIARPTRRVAVLLNKSSRSMSTIRDQSPALKTAATVKLHHATAVVAARLRLFDAGPIDPGGSALALLTLDSPLLLFANDRFILRDLSGRFTLAGGLILDPSPPASPHRRPDYLHALHQLAEHSNDPAAHLFARLSHSPAILREEFLAQSNFDDRQIAQGIARAIEQHQCIAIDSLLFYAPFWSMLRNVVKAVVNEHHQLHPEQAGLPLADVRAALASASRPAIPKALLPPLEAAILSNIAALGLARDNGTLRSASHSPLLPPKLRAAGQALQKYLAEHPFDPPSRKELAPNDLAQQALRFLIATGHAIQLSPEVVLSANACDLAIEKIREHLKTHQAATVSQLKTLLASNRRVMVPLLEHLDRTGVTRRRGDLRSLAGEISS